MSLERHELRLLGVLYLVAFAADALWRSMLAGYATRVVGVEAGEIALVFSAAAVPGLASVLLLGALRHVGSLAFALVLALFVAAGSLMAGALATGVGTLVVAAFGMGAAMTCFYVVANSLCLAMMGARDCGPALGRLKSFGPAASLLAALLVLLAIDARGSRGLLYLAGAGIGMLALLLSFGTARRVLQAPRIARVRPRVVLSWRMAPYYTLNLVAGVRSALFKTVVIVYLVQAHGLDVASTATLILAGNVVAFFGYRITGAALVRFPRATVLRAIYAVVAFCFAGLWLVAVDGHGAAWPANAALVFVQVLFLLDSAALGASVVCESWLRCRGAPAEVPGHVASGVTLYHVAAVLAPLAFAPFADAPAPMFVVGVIVALVGMLLAGRLERTSTAHVARRSATQARFATA